MPDCQHWEGDEILGYWLCAKCYAKLPERPFRLVRRYADKGGPPQHIVCAPIAKADGMTLGRFVAAMALRLIARTSDGWGRAEATDYAVECLRTAEVPFGDPDYAWDTGAAWVLIDEDLQHWDADISASN